MMVSDAVPPTFEHTLDAIDGTIIKNTLVFIMAKHRLFSILFLHLISKIIAPASDASIAQDGQYDDARKADEIYIRP